MQVELHHITKQYEGNPYPVLDDISLNIESGSSVAIVGPSGSGKSTLLNLVGTLDEPTSGEVWLDGVSSRGLMPEALASLRNNNIGFVFQTHLLLPQLTLIENVLLPVLPQEKERQQPAQERALRLLRLVGLADKTTRYPHEMSVGECQRGAVVRALINEPGLVLADEPTGSLDHDSAERLSDIIMELKTSQSFTLITVTHSPDLARRMETAYTLVNGKIALT
jgi:ABC-type lipoprotein export system ATPase subunit